jgi:cysteine desulfurase
LSPEFDQPIFLDHAAGSPLRSEVATAMAAALVGLPPNPSGAHRLARATNAVLEDARDTIASMLGTKAQHIVFTGGGTESCNLAIFGVTAPTAVCISAIEHLAVRQPAAQRARELGVELIELPVHASGVLDLDRAVELVPDGALVSVMAANNETGAIQPVAELAKRLRHARHHVVVHCDAIAAAPMMELRDVVAACDLVSIAGHKVGGPPGTAILVVDETTRIHARIVGGGQELERRAGTQDVAGAVGVAAALELTRQELEAGAIDDVAARRDHLQATIVGAFPDVRVFARDVPRLAGHLMIAVPGARSEEILMLLDQHGICASAGAACSSGAPQASNVLLNMGVCEEEARSTLRLTLSVHTSDAELDRATAVLLETLSRLTAPLGS